MLHSDLYGNRQGDEISVLTLGKGMLTAYHRDGIWEFESNSGLGDMYHIKAYADGTFCRVLINDDWAGEPVDFSESDGDIDLVG